MVERARYFLWATFHSLDRDRSCPSCGSTSSSVLRRKRLVTQLLQCDLCGLRYRFPKGDLQSEYAFYQRRYTQGFTTECPSDVELDYLITSEFRGTEKDFSAYVSVLEAMGLPKGSRLLDFGSSWGYGSWQLSKAGYKLFSYEISEPRATYARDKLGCEMVTKQHLANLEVDCFFSSHVIEHLSDPNVLWQVARTVLSPWGKIFVTTPNGEPEMEQILGAKRYHQHWGRVHPLLFTARSLKAMALRYGFEARTYTSPYPYDAIRERQEGPLQGIELLLIGWLKETEVSGPVGSSFGSRQGQL